MRCPELSELPPPPPDKVGWPWTEESRRLPVRTSAGDNWPRISIITPSFNQGEFIEETIRSVLLQGYPDLEYLVLDGGSSDGSLDIIGKYSRWLSYWISERDGGQSDAINRGLRRASGRFATWINSDDLLCKNAFTDHASNVGFDEDVVYAGHCVHIDRNGRPTSRHRGRVHSFEDLVRIKQVWRADPPGYIDQPATIFPRALAISVGALDADNHSTMDYELWGKFFLAGAKFQYTDIEFGMFREHPGQKTQDTLRLTRSLLSSAARLINRSDLDSTKKDELLIALDAYSQEYTRNCWRGTGRLARLGLPIIVVNSIRNVRKIFQRTMTAS
jgi:glycosyltransferase involved in cell wall biosynthesis